MTSAPLFRWNTALRIGLFSALAGTLGVACCNCEPQLVYPRNLQAFALPSGCPTGAHPSNTTELNACLVGIEFDTTETMGDEQRLMVRDSTPTGPRCHGDTLFACTYGPLAKIEPVKGAESYGDSALAQGRIIARLFLRAGETDSYPKLGLVPGDTTYWWVKIVTSQDTMMFVHRDTVVDNPLIVTGRGLERNPHPQGTFQQGLARWVWVEDDEKANGACGSGCCRPS